MDADATRGRVLLEESRESVVVLDAEDRVIAGSRRARQSIDGLREGEKIPDGLLSGEAGIIPLVVPYDVRGRRERLVYLSRGGDLTAYEELRTGFTAAVSHELRTPLARLLSLLEMATLPGEDVAPPRRPGAQRGRADPRADRRGALPQRARVRVRASSRSAPSPSGRSSRRWPPSSRSARAAPASRSPSRATRGSSSRSGRA